MSNPSCAPSSDEILKSLRTRFKVLQDAYEESLKVNNDLANKLKFESKNQELIKSLKRQRTYLGRFIFSYCFIIVLLSIIIFSNSVFSQENRTYCGGID